jgi:hypothetical protein
VLFRSKISTGERHRLRLELASSLVTISQLVKSRQQLPRIRPHLQ